MNLWVVDIEGDGLQASKLHCMAATNETGTFSTTDYEEMIGMLEGADVIVGHNFERWDKPTAERILKTEIKARIVDTLALSWILFPDRHKHGLESWGEDFGVPKPDIEDWHTLTPEEYLHRCQEDTKINWLLWQLCWKKLTSLYDNEEDIWRYLDYIEFKMGVAALKERNRWRLDKELASKTLAVMEEEQRSRLDKLSTVMPKVPIIKERTYPAKPLKKDGTLSEHGKKWVALCEEKGLPRTYKEPIEVIVGYDDPNPGSVQQVKSWLTSLGWRPRTFKYVKDDKSDFKSKPRAIPQISKTPQEGGGICSSISDMFEKYPELEVLDGLSVLTHRKSVVKGFLENVDEEGYLQAKIQGLTNTLRVQHAVIVNLPRIDRRYGQEIRGSLVADKGTVLVGSDLSSVEDRVKQHFAFKFDPEYVERVNVPGYDPHLRIAVLGDMLTEDQAEAYKKGDKQYKPIRDIAKNVSYSGQYGAGPPKMALTGGFSLELAKKLHAAYWKENWFIKAVAEEQKVKTIDDQMWLLNPINGFYYSLRNEKDIFSTLVQGTATYCFDIWVGFTLQEYDGIIGDFHDEQIYRIEESKAPWLAEVIEESMQKTNEYLNLNRVLGCETQTGTRYSDIH